MQLRKHHVGNAGGRDSPVFYLNCYKNILYGTTYTASDLSGPAEKACCIFGERWICVTTSVGPSLNFPKFFMPQLQNGDSTVNIMVLRESDA